MFQSLAHVIWDGANLLLWNEYSYITFNETSPLRVFFSNLCSKSKAIAMTSFTLSHEMRHEQIGRNVNEASFEDSCLRNSVLIQRFVLFQITFFEYPSKSFEWHQKVTFDEQQDRGNNSCPIKLCGRILATRIVLFSNTTLPPPLTLG